MAITYEEVTPSLIKNTTMRKSIENGADRAYYITPCEGYILHDKDLDSAAVDTDTFEPTGEVISGFYAGTRSVRHDYDFAVNPREFYTVSETEKAQPEEAMPKEEI